MIDINWYIITKFRKIDNNTFFVSNDCSIEEIQDYFSKKGLNHNDFVFVKTIFSDYYQNGIKTKIPVGNIYKRGNFNGK